MSYLPYPTTMTVTGGASPLPVSGTVTANINGTVPVSGTFWQQTQPVSISSMPTTPVTGTFWQSTQPVSIAATVAVSGPLTDVQLRASPVPISVATIPTHAVTQSGTWTVTGPLTDTQLRAAAVPVSGTFWQATQPISGTVAVSGSVAVTGTFWQATQPVSIAATVAVSGPLTDTQLRASAVPVSIATMPSTPVTGTFWQATQPVSIAATVATRDLKDNGRTLFSAATVIAGVTAVTTEALLSVIQTRAGVAAGAATSIVVTAGKTLRITGIIFSGISTAAAVFAGRCALRMNPSGAAIATSPIIAILSITQQAAALAQAGDTCVLPLPDGLEFSGTQQIGLTQICSATTGTVWVSMIGFEY
jgi:hypothetical protein